MEKHIAVIGAGGTGQAAAADLTLAGLKVSLFEQARYAKNLEPVSGQGGIHLTGAHRTGFANVHKITSDIEEALKDADVIVIAVVASRHEEIAALCAPHLKDGQIIAISPGNAGSMIFADQMKKQGVKTRVMIAEFEGNLYPARLIGPGEAIIALPYKSKRIAAFPARDTAQVVEGLKGVYDTTAAANVFEAALNTPNVVIHLAASLLNMGSVEQSGGEYYLYTSGLTPSVLRCVEAVHAEKRNLFDVLGYRDNSPIEHLKLVARQTEFPELDLFRGLIGPTGPTHRYITEDASTCVSLMISLGEMLGVPMPLSKAIVEVASTINQVNYLEEGRTLEKFGLTGLTVDQLNRFLSEGKK
ncbi:MAG: NAD/NADP octopine/nopaline dehydrogenase family protein [Deltaproteobacteria bacterium]|nr:NAD/NADP octopine/nopaline dehydrogenase family protein [Deltaproteobacteria bacterium]